MKKWILGLLSVVLLFTVTQFARPEAVHASTSWTTTKMSWKGGTLTLIYPSSLAPELSRMQWLAGMADRSQVTTTPLTSTASGLIASGDVIVVNASNLFWFDITNTGSSSTNGGGGLMRGWWPLVRDGSAQINFERIVNTSNYAPNYFFPGSKVGLQGSGISLLGNYTNIDDGNTWAIEHDAAAISTSSTGQSITDGGIFHHDGVFVQFQGYLCNSPNVTLPAGIDSACDVDKRSGIEGRVQYTLTYRIPSVGNEFKQEITLEVKQNQFGPIATMVVSNNLPGYENNSIYLGSSPALNNVNLTQLNASSTYAYSVSGYSMQFYELPWVAHSGYNRWAETTLGQGGLASAGAPQLTYPVRFMEYRPDTSVVPNALQNTYALQSIDNQGINSNRVIALDYQLFDTNRGQSHQSFATGSQIRLDARYVLR